MQNVNMQVKGNKLMIEIDHTVRLGQSSSGKSTVVASTGGNVEVPNAPGIKLGLNVYVPTKAGTAAVVRDMKNVQTTVKGSKLTLVIDLTQDHGTSSTGKSFQVATTGGNTAIADAPEIRIGLNVYKPIKPGQAVQQTLV
jgi:hypothetical protein